jgi:4-hydroxy-tetrahydrodipicolinate reductase
MKYGVIGASGRLGTEVINLFNQNKHQLVFRYDLDGEKRSDIPEVLVDCSLPQVFRTTLKFGNKFNIPLIVATTGLTNANIKSLKSYAKKNPVVQSYNFSIGIQVLLKLTEIAKDSLKDWDVEIMETHHRFKKDKPSGTAKMIQELFAEKKINTSSLRLGNISGDHSVSFGGLGEVLTISHRALSRRTFAEGILMSAKFASNKKKGFFTFKDVVFGKK